MLHVPEVLFGGYEMHTNIVPHNHPINEDSDSDWNVFMSCQSNSIPDYSGSFHNIIKWRVARARFNASSSSQEADTDDQQGTLTYEEFSVFYKMMSLRRDVFLLMMAYSDRKDHLTADELANFLRNEQKVRARAGTQPFLWSRLWYHHCLLKHWLVHPHEESSPDNLSLPEFAVFQQVLFSAIHLTFCWSFIEFNTHFELNT